MKIIEINEENFTNEVINSEKKIVIDFYANWCGPCQMLRPILEELASDYENFKFVSINVDENEKLVSQFNISSIPCLVLTDKDREIKRIIGFKSREELIEFLGGI